MLKRTGTSRGVNHRGRHEIRVNALLIISALLVIMPLQAEEKSQSSVSEGQRLALEFCQACHQFRGTDQAGTVAPPLMGIKTRFPDRKKLYAIIYDPQDAINKHTMMPPFGRNDLMASDEIEKVIDFLYTL